jgi:hypothetical protein
VIQTSYDIAKAHGGELKVETKEGLSAEALAKVEEEVSLLFNYLLSESRSNRIKRLH